MINFEVITIKNKYLFKNMKEMLKIIKNNNFPLDFEENERGYGSYPVVYCSNLEKNIAEVAIKDQLVEGLDTRLDNNDMWMIIASSPTLTPKGEEYLKNNNFFNKHPFLEKLLLVILTGIISAITTLLVNYFTN